jgi:glutamate/tyrosine decarboxylase-like PLP-dependent enzyme
VNTGTCDPLPAIADATEKAGAWLHVDGASGMWAAASPSLRHLCEGVERAGSWATDAHKWLNVPYDSGIAFCAHPHAHRAAMGVQADYLIHDDDGRCDQIGLEPGVLSPGARLSDPCGAALARPLRCRRDGRALLRRARRFAERLGAEDGVEILNDVVLNQVLVRIVDGPTTEEVMRLVRESGEAWPAGTTWAGDTAMRISVSNWQTTDVEVDRAVAATRQAASIAARSVLT